MSDWKFGDVLRRRSGVPSDMRRVMVVAPKMTGDSRVVGHKVFPLVEVSEYSVYVPSTYTGKGSSDIIVDDNWELVDD